MPTVIKSATANALFFEGVLRRNPELAYAPDGSAIATLLLSAEFTETNMRTGEINTVTLWVKAICSGTLAETVAASLSKGDQVALSGRLVPAEAWLDKERKPQGVNVMRIMTLSRVERLAAPASQPPAARALPITPSPTEKEPKAIPADMAMETDPAIPPI